MPTEVKTTQDYVPALHLARLVSRDGLQRDILLSGHGYAPSELRLPLRSRNRHSLKSPDLIERVTPEIRTYQLRPTSAVDDVWVFDEAE